MKFSPTVCNIIWVLSTKVIKVMEKMAKMNKMKTKIKNKKKKTKRKRRNPKKKKNLTQRARTKKLLQVKNPNVNSNDLCDVSNICKYSLVN